MEERDISEVGNRNADVLCVWPTSEPQHPKKFANTKSTFPTEKRKCNIIPEGESSWRET